MSGSSGEGGGICSQWFQKHQLSCARGAAFPSGEDEAESQVISKPCLLLRKWDWPTESYLFPLGDAGEMDVSYNQPWWGLMDPKADLW